MIIHLADSVPASGECRLPPILGTCSMKGTRQSPGDACGSSSSWSPKATKPLSSRSPPSPWPRPAAGVQLGEEQKEGGVRGRDSYFVQFGYLRQRDRLAEDVACVLLLELLQGFAKEDEKRGQLHLHGNLLDLDLTHIKAQSARPRPVPWSRSEEMVKAGLGICLPSHPQQLGVLTQIYVLQRPTQ